LFIFGAVIIVLLQLLTFIEVVVNVPLKYALVVAKKYATEVSHHALK